MFKFVEKGCRIFQLMVLCRVSSFILRCVCAHVPMVFGLGFFNSSWSFVEDVSGSNTLQPGSGQLQRVVHEHYGKSTTPCRDESFSCCTGRRDNRVINNCRIMRMP